MKTEIYQVTVEEGYRTTWELDENLHRTDGPAVEYVDGSKFWWRHGKMHREDGPAVILSNGRMLWRLDGNALTEAEHAAEMKKRNAPVKPACDGKTVEIDGVKYKLSAV